MIDYFWVPRISIIFSWIYNHNLKYLSSIKVNVNEDEICMFQKDDFLAVSSVLRQYLPEKDTPYILDIDLDFFSTKNPFKNLYDRVNLYDKLATLYAFQRPDSTDHEVSTRK